MEKGGKMALSCSREVNEMPLIAIIQGQTTFAFFEVSKTFPQVGPQPPSLFLSH